MTMGMTVFVIMGVAMAVAVAMAVPVPHRRRVFVCGPRVGAIWFGRETKAHRCWVVGRLGVAHVAVVFVVEVVQGGHVRDSSSWWDSGQQTASLVLSLRQRDFEKAETSG